MSNQYDHCRNCKFWNKDNQNEDKKALCTIHNQKAYIRSWCGQHVVANKYDYNDPSVIHSLHMDIFIRSGNPNIKSDTILEILRALGYTGPDDFYSVLREYDINYPHWKDSVESEYR